MDSEILNQSEEILKELDRISKFGSKYGIYPYERVRNLSKQLVGLSNSITPTDFPSSQEQLLESELKRRVIGESFHLDQLLSDRNLDFEAIVSIFNIPMKDIEGLERWLLEHRDEALSTVERLFDLRDVKSYELALQMDIPVVRQQAEGYVALRLRNHHKAIGKMLQDLAGLGEFLSQIDAVPTTGDRSYFNSLTKTLAIGIPSVCFTTQNGTPQIREREFIEIYGHEGMGHGLNHLLTEKSVYPYFLKWDSRQTSSTLESVAQFYERHIFEDLKKNPEVLRELDILHKFEDIYTEHHDVEMIESYKRTLFHYAIFVLADKSLGDHGTRKVIDEKIKKIQRVTLAPSFPVNFVESAYKDKFDSHGNLDSELVSELRYCAQPVKRALEEFKRKGIVYNGKDRALIDATLLTGFWTPEGYVQNARLKAEEAARKL